MIHLSIVICDDDINVQFAIEQYLKDIFNEYAIDADIDCYDSGEELCDHFEKGKFDLVFLDIEFNGMNGVAVGRFIRETVGDELVQIAYISGNTGYAMELFEYRPINFLVKPIVKGEIRKIIDKYLVLNDKKIEKFQYKVGSNFFQISLSEIVYFSSTTRKVTLHTMRETAEFYDSLEFIYQKVKAKQFLYVHKSFIVNCQYIKKMEYEKVTLIDGTVIPISQSRRAAIRRQFLQIKTGEM